MIPQERQLLEEDIVGYFFLGEYYEQNGDIEKAISIKPRYYLSEIPSLRTGKNNPLYSSRNR
jgi:hypothetical protein